MWTAGTARDDGGRIATDGLRGWLGRQRDLRGRVKREPAGAPAPGTMGTATELITGLLAPGGVATVLAAAVVTWARNRTRSRTVSVVRPDGTEVTVTSDRVKGPTAEQTGEPAQRIARQPGPGEQRSPERPDQQDPESRQPLEPSAAEPRQSSEGSRAARTRQAPEIPHAPVPPRPSGQAPTARPRSCGHRRRRPTGRS